MKHLFKQCILMYCVGTLIFITSCNQEDFPLSEDNGLTNLEEVNSDDAILVFKDREQFYKVMDQSAYDNAEMRSSPENSDDADSVTELLDSESLYGASDYEEFWCKYIPSSRVAKKFNKKGEIMINDTIYKITTNGTYFYHKTKKSEFKKNYDADSTAKGTLIDGLYYRMSENVYRHDSFWNIDEYESFEFNNNAFTQVGFRNYGSEPDYDSFPSYNNERTTILGKLIQNIIGQSKDFTVYYNHTNNRRVKGSFYDLNLGVYATCGAEGWTDKKNWIGWSKTEAEQLRVGWHNVVLITKLPNYDKMMAQQMFNSLPSSIITANQYISIPGSIYKVNAVTMLTRGFDATLFDKAVSLGTPAVFSFLKSLSGNAPQLNQNSVALILTPTHLITYIPNEDIINNNCKHYDFTFATQVKFKLSFNPASIPSSFWDWAGTIGSIIMNATKMEYPTLAAGEAHISARFGTEWQGMVIKKRQSNIILKALQN